MHGAAVVLTGTRESEQPIQRYSGFCWDIKRLKNSGSLSRCSAAQCLRAVGITRCLLTFKGLLLLTYSCSTAGMHKLVTPTDSFHVTSLQISFSLYKLRAVLGLMLAMGLECGCLIPHTSHPTCLPGANSEGHPYDCNCCRSTA